LRWHIGLLSIGFRLEWEHCGNSWGSALETRWVTKEDWVSSENSYIRKRFGVCVRSGPNDSAKASEAEGDALGHLNMLRKYTSFSRPNHPDADLALRTVSSIAKDDLTLFERRNL
jgi:hypothetical protein